MAQGRDAFQSPLPSGRSTANQKIARGDETDAHPNVIMAQRSINALLKIEDEVPLDQISPTWPKKRKAWRERAQGARTIREVGTSLLELEEGLRAHYQADSPLVDRAVWRQKIAGLHTYEGLAKQIKVFKDAVDSLPPIPESPRGPIKRRLKLEGPKAAEDAKRPKKASLPSDSSDDEVQFEEKIERSGKGGGKLGKGGKHKRGTDSLEVSLEDEKNLLASKESDEFDASAIAGRGVERSTRLKGAAGLKRAGEDELAGLLASFEKNKPGARGLETAEEKEGQGEEDESEDEDEFEKRYAGIPVTAEEARLGSGNFGALVSGDVSPESGPVSGRSDASARASDGSLRSFEPPALPVGPGLKRKRSTADLLRRRASGSLSEGPKQQKTSSDDADVNSPRAAAASDEALSPGQSEARSESPVESEQAEEADEDFDEEEEEDAEMEEEEPPKKEPAKNRSHKKAPLVTKGPKKGGKLPGRKHSVRDGLAKPLALDVASIRGRLRAPAPSLTPPTPAKGESKTTAETATSQKDKKKDGSPVVLKLPKEMRGRWSTERYKTAQLKLVDIMHRRGAGPEKPILRQILREEARKDIGDTGLLDHLLKHMTDTVVGSDERFRRRHNPEGHMEYWLEAEHLLELRKTAGLDPTSPMLVPLNPAHWPNHLHVGGAAGAHNAKSPQDVAEAKKASKEAKDLRASVSGLREEVQRLSQKVKNAERRAIQREETREKDARGALDEVKEEVGRVEERARRRVQLVRQSIQSIRDELAEVRDEQQRQATATRDDAAARKAAEADGKRAAEAQKEEVKEREQRAREEVEARVEGVKGDAEKRAAGLEQKIIDLQKKLEDTSTALETDIARALEEARGRLEAIFLDRQEMRGDINKVVELIAGLQARSSQALAYPGATGQPNRAAFTATASPYLPTIAPSNGSVPRGISHQGLPRAGVPTQISPEAGNRDQGHPLGRINGAHVAGGRSDPLPAALQNGAKLSGANLH